MSIKLVISEKPVSNLTVTSNLPIFPLFVVITITPFPAREPYKEEAEAPFTISIDAISCTLISAKPPSTKIPSMMIKGNCVAKKPVGPRITIPAPPPGRPEFITATPATFP